MRYLPAERAPIRVDDTPRTDDDRDRHAGHIGTVRGLEWPDRLHAEILENGARTTRC